MSDITFEARRLKKDYDQNFKETMTYETRRLSFPADETAVVISDMWAEHWCEGATRRVAELAVQMNELLDYLRNKGVKIIHCPSGTEEVYKDAPQKRALDNYRTYPSGVPSEIGLFTEGIIPDITSRIDPRFVQCDCSLEKKCDSSRKPWKSKGQISSLTIAENDLIGMDAETVTSYLKKERYQCVFMMGVHTNMCVIYRKFGLKRLRMLKILPVLVRDMTDCMIPREEPPYQDHFTALDHTVRFIEEYICPSTTKMQLMGGMTPSFTFSDDRRYCFSSDWGGGQCGEVFDDYDLYLNRRLLDPVKIRLWTAADLKKEPGISGIEMDYFGTDIPAHGDIQGRERAISIPFGDYISEIVIKHGVYSFPKTQERVIFMMEFYGKSDSDGNKEFLGDIVAGKEEDFTAVTTVTLTAPKNYRLNSLAGVFSPHSKKLNYLAFHSQPARLFETITDGIADTVDVLEYDINEATWQAFFINGCWRHSTEEGRAGVAYDVWYHEDETGAITGDSIEKMAVIRESGGTKPIKERKAVKCRVSDGRVMEVRTAFEY